MIWKFAYHVVGRDVVGADVVVPPSLEQPPEDSSPCLAIANLKSKMSRVLCDVLEIIVYIYIYMPAFQGRWKHSEKYHSESIFFWQIVMPVGIASSTIFSLR
jgi:hypothetical protein